MYVESEILQGGSGNAAFPIAGEHQSWGMGRPKTDLIPESPRSCWGRGVTKKIMIINKHIMRTTNEKQVL
ncbi:hypothetical protein [Levilactobacillus fujinensis]|uniref:Uncharacterized protein n=1 Tax=Levilactobacillus fujinensis TaxID=2486024 RepID=A0ABW1TGX1_9LACO|nr:hypothetical protein [Levilactobacillus fujinensis]